MRLFSEDEFSNLVTEISLKNGFGLFYELEPVGELSKNKVYRLVGDDKSALLCLDNDLHDETIEGLKLNQTGFIGDDLVPIMRRE